MERRKSLRVPIRCQISFSCPTSGAAICGMATLTNLSKEGWAIASPLPLKKGMVLSLRVYLPETPPPPVMAETTVLWVKNDTFGLQSIKMQDKDRRRLHWFMISRMPKSCLTSSRFQLQR